MIDRRTFLAGTGAVLLAAPLVAEAQQVTRVPRVGYLSPLTASADGSRSEAFRQGLRELGYVEGQNVIFERRYAGGHLERVPDLAAELVRMPVDVIAVTGPTPVGPP